MSQGLNGALRSATHALRLRGDEADWSIESVIAEAKRVAPGCRDITRRKVKRAFARQFKKAHRKVIKKFSQSTGAP